MPYLFCRPTSKTIWYRIFFYLVNSVVCLICHNFQNLQLLIKTKLASFWFSCVEWWLTHILLSSKKIYWVQFPVFLFCLISDMWFDMLDFKKNICFFQYKRNPIFLQLWQYLSRLSSFWNIFQKVGMPFFWAAPNLGNWISLCLSFLSLLYFFKIKLLWLCISLLIFLPHE